MSVAVEGKYISAMPRNTAHLILEHDEVKDLDRLRVQWGSRPKRSQSGLRLDKAEENLLHTMFKNWDAARRSQLLRQFHSPLGSTIASPLIPNRSKQGGCHFCSLPTHYFIGVRARCFQH